MRVLSHVLMVLALGLVGAGLVLHYAVGLRLHVVLSDSMVPTFKAGDLLVTKNIPTEELRVGDVPVLIRADLAGPVAHRVVEVEHGTVTSLVTKGDANSSSDPALIVKASEVPVAVTALPAHAQLLLTNSAVRGSLVLVAGLVTIASLVQMHRRRQCKGCTCQDNDRAAELEMTS